MLDPRYVRYMSLAARAAAEPRAGEIVPKDEALASAVREDGAPSTAEAS